MAAWTALYTAAGTTIGATEYSISLASTSGAPASKTDKVSACCSLDLNALAIGDVFKLTLYDKCRSGDTQRVVESWYVGVNNGPNFITPPFMIGEGWDFTLKKISGTDRTIPASIRAYS